MNILTVENEPYDLDKMPEIIDDVRFCVLDFGKERRHIEEPDFYFNSLVFMEKFSSPAALLQIGPYLLKVPLDWNILITSEEFDEMCMVPVSSLPKRGFSAFVYNPLRGGLPQALPVDISTIFRSNEWHMPKLNIANLLATPMVNNTKNPHRNEPLCVYIVRDTSHIPKYFSLADLL